MQVIIKNNKDRILLITIFLIISTVSVLRNFEGMAIAAITFLIILPFIRYLSRAIYGFTVGDQYTIELDMEALYKQCRWDIKVAVKRIEEYYLEDFSMELLASRLNRLRNDNQIQTNTIIGVMSGLMVLVISETGLIELFKSNYIDLNNHNLINYLISIAFYIMLGIFCAIVFGSIYIIFVWMFFRPNTRKVVKKYLQEYEIGVIESKIEKVIES